MKTLITVLIALMGVVVAAQPQQDILQSLASNGFTAIADLAAKSGLGSLVASSGPFTVFAPTNEAFLVFPPQFLARLYGVPDVLKNIVTYHISAPALQPDELRDETTVTTLSGGRLRINEYDQLVTVNGAAMKILSPISATNGIIYPIESILIPDVERSIADMLYTDPRFSTLVKAIEIAGLVDTLKSDDGAYTLFAPTNDAFRALPAGVLDNLIAEPETLKRVLLGHVVPGTKYYRGLSTGTLSMANGRSAKAIVSTDDLQRSAIIDDSPLSQIDMTASNGVIHVLDKVLLPKEF